MSKKFMRLPEVMARTGLGKSTIHRLAKQGGFPCPVQIGERASAWVEEEIDEWCAARITRRDQGVSAVSRKISDAP